MRKPVKSIFAMVACAALAYNAYAAGPADTGTTISASDHVSAIETYRQKEAGILAEIDKFNGFIAAADKKPYRDSKGLKRRHWRVLVGQRHRKLATTQQLISWHTARLERLHADRQRIAPQEQFDES